jgi:hypothetical protein
MTDLSATAPNPSTGQNKQTELNQPNSLILPGSWILGLTTIPLLLGLVGGASLLGGMVQLGQASEEILRGRRLPTLKFSSEEH